MKCNASRYWYVKYISRKTSVSLTSYVHPFSFSISTSLSSTLIRLAFVSRCNGWRIGGGAILTQNMHVVVCESMLADLYLGACFLTFKGPFEGVSTPFFYLYLMRF